MVDVLRLFSMVTVTPVFAERATFHTGAGALATSTKTPVVDLVAAQVRLGDAVVALPGRAEDHRHRVGRPHASSRLANWPALRIRCVLSSSASLSPCQRPPGAKPTRVREAPEGSRSRGPPHAKS